MTVRAIRTSKDEFRLAASEPLHRTSTFTAIRCARLSLWTKKKSRMRPRQPALPGA